MFERKYPVLLYSQELGLVRLDRCACLGLARRRIVTDGGSHVMVLNNDGSVSGSKIYDRWELL